MNNGAFRSRWNRPSTETPKNASGIISSSRKKKNVAKWELKYYEILATVNFHRRLPSIGSSFYELEVSSSFSKTATEVEESNN